MDCTLFAVGAMPMDRDVWVSDSGLFEVFVDTAAATFINTGQFDGNAGPGFDFGAGFEFGESDFGFCFFGAVFCGRGLLVGSGRFGVGGICFVGVCFGGGLCIGLRWWRAWVVGVPDDVVIAHVGEAFFAGWDIDAFSFAIDDFGLILFGIDLEEEVVDGRAFGSFREDLHGSSGSEHTVHPCGADTDALLPAAHAQAVEFASVEELSEDVWDLFFDDTWAVVLDGDAESARLSLIDTDPDFGEYACFFAGIEGVVDSFFDGGQEGFAGVIEPEEVSIFREEFADRYIALFRGHRFGGGASGFGRWVAHQRGYLGDGCGGVNQ